MFCCGEQPIFSYKWLSLAEHILRPEIFEMAAMPFSCNIILLIQDNIQGVSHVFTLNHARCLIPYVNLSLIVFQEV